MSSSVLCGFRQNTYLQHIYPGREVLLLSNVALSQGATYHWYCEFAPKGFPIVTQYKYSSP